MLEKDKTLLHVIDVQEKLFRVIHDHEKLEQDLVRLVKGIRVLNIPIIWMEQYPEGIGPTIQPLKQELTGLEPFQKMCFSSCGVINFPEKRKETNRSQVLVCGIEAHVCVYQTVRDLLNDGFEVYLVADAVSSRKMENRDYAIRIMESMGARLTTVEMALFELLKEAGTDEFRRISRIIK